MTFEKGKVYLIKSLTNAQHNTVYESTFVGKKMRYTGAGFLFLESERESVENSEWLKSSRLPFNSNGREGWDLREPDAELVEDDEPYIFP